MSLAESTFAYFVSCPPGLEGVLQDDLRAIGVETRTVLGGAEGRGALHVLYTILHRSRVAESLRVRLRPFRATDFGALYSGLTRLPWHAYLNGADDVDVSVTCHKSRLYHSDAVKERVVAALTRAFSAKQRPPVVDGAPRVPARIFVRLDHDVVQVSVDASGERLHRRGYRTHVVEAPLRETLAAAIVRLAGAEALPPRAWDPFCGSGTLALEWLSLVEGVAPRRENYALDSWPICKGKGGLAQGGAGEVHDRAAGAEPPRAWLSDTDPRAIAAARHNAEAAGLLGRCEFQHCDFEQAARAVPPHTLVLANPPYGVRLDTQSAASKLLARFERLLVSRADLRPALIVCPEGLLRGTRRVAWKPVARFANGGVPVTVFRAEA